MCPTHSSQPRRGWCQRDEKSRDPQQSLREKPTASEVDVQPVRKNHLSAVKQRGREKKGPPNIVPKSFSKKGPKWCSAECTAVAAIQLRMRMRILTRPANSLANFSHQITNKKLQIKRCEGIRQRMPKISSSLRKFLADGSLRQNSLANANAMAWCTRDGPLFFPRSHREICTRNRPLSETKFLDDFWGPLPRPAPLFCC